MEITDNTCSYGPCVCGQSHGGWEPCVGLVDAIDDAVLALESEAAGFVNNAESGGKTEGEQNARDNERKADLLRRHVAHLRDLAVAGPSPWRQDVAALLGALGLSDHARPTSCQEIVQTEILPAIRTLRGDVLGQAMLLCGRVATIGNVEKRCEMSDLISDPSAEAPPMTKNDDTTTHFERRDCANAVANHLGLNPADDIPFEDLAQRLWEMPPIDGFGSHKADLAELRRLQTLREQAIHDIEALPRYAPVTYQGVHPNGRFIDREAVLRILRASTQTEETL